MIELTDETKKGMKPQDLTEFRKKIRTNDGLYFGRIPKRTREEFSKFAKEEFCGDYGMALKCLWDDMNNSQELNVLLLRLEQLEQRIQVLENPVKETKTTDEELIEQGKAKRMASGAIRRIRK